MILILCVSCSLNVHERDAKLIKRASTWSIFHKNVFVDEQNSGIIGGKQYMYVNQLLYKKWTHIKHAI